MELIMNNTRLISDLALLFHTRDYQQGLDILHLSMQKVKLFS